MKLTSEQLNHFHTFGFVIFKQLLSASEMKRYSVEFNAGLDSWIEDGEHDRQERHYATLMDEDSPFIASLADDPRFADVAEQLIGPGAMCIGVDGNYMVGDTGWHPDTASLHYKAVKFCIYPDTLTGQDGALRVIPGSHCDPLHSQLEREPEPAYGVRPDEVPAFAFESNPGDVIVFNVGVWHGSFGGGNHRRQGVVVYYEDPQTPEATEEVVAAMQWNQEFIASKGRQAYGEHWRSIDNPRHQQWLRRLDELGVLETPPSPGR